MNKIIDALFVLVVTGLVVLYCVSVSATPTTTTAQVLITSAIVNADEVAELQAQGWIIIDDLN